ncbi:zinc finger protein 460-like [Uranotaenia lowii]|uniref:zinc finger protein 460-like n=1 Tax=Uranotaenia lowii TaxID=190385 RepID=UPI002478B514|nr:zinc finger protein 460-like [Uranotaenia lowii]
MPASCVVPDCKMKYAHSEDVSYHKFPFRNTELLAKWIEFTGRGPDWIPTKWTSICSRHFRSDDFKDCIYRKNLKPSAVPCIEYKIIKQGEDQHESFALKHNPQFIQSGLESSETETDHEELSCPDESQLLDITCRLCGIVFSKWCQGLLVEIRQHATDICKCLPFINLEVTQFPQKVCSHCMKVIHGFSAFYDNVSKAQQDLEDKYIRSCQADTRYQVETVEPAKIRIKQEPFIKIKEETVDSGTKTKELIPETVDSSLIIKNPSVTNDKNKILLFNNQNNDIQGSKQYKDSKSCEILEIVNLYPPIVDITSATIREVQPYEITLPSMAGTMVTFQQSNPQIVNLKTENTAEEEEEEYDEGSGYYPDHVAGLDSLEEHSYSKLPIQATDDNKDEIFANSQHSTESINLGENGTIRVIHVELPPQQHLIEQPLVLNFPCQTCNQKFSSRLKLLKHRVFKCPYTAPFASKCVYCQKTIHSLSRSKIHKMVCYKKISQRKIRFTNAKKVLSKLKIRKPKPVKTFKCTMCDRTYSRMSNLNKHTASHRPLEQWNHKCGICLKIFDKLFDLKRHFRLSKCAGGSVDNMAIPSGDGGRLLYVCTSCNKQYKTYNGLKVHENEHTRLKAFVCETCGKRFGGQLNLTQHMLCHVDVKSFSCKLCPKVFKRNGGLTQHIKAFHMQIKPYRCTVCGRDYALKADMTRCRHSRLKDVNRDCL